MLTCKEIENWLKFYGVKNYNIDKNLIVNINGNVDLTGDSTIWKENNTKVGLKFIPFKFGIVKGFFNCAYNQIESLKGFPEIVHGNLTISYNNLKNLNHCPKIIKGDFHCRNNNLQSLNGAPLYIGGDFDICNTGIESFDGIHYSMIIEKSISTDFSRLSKCRNQFENFKKELEFDLIASPLVDLTHSNKKKSRL